MADEHHELDRRRNQAELAETYADIRQWSDSAHRFEATAEDARRIAHLLDDEIGQLRRIFDPVRALHTSSTWEGNAADQSRRRLDRHEDQLTIGLWQIDRLVDQLETKAIAATRAADASRDSIDSAQRRAWSLEAELGRHDTIFL